MEGRIRVTCCKGKEGWKGRIWSLRKYLYATGWCWLCIRRYQILAPKAIPVGFMDGRKAAEALIGAMQLEENEYRLGHSKVRTARKRV